MSKYEKYFRATVNSALERLWVELRHSIYRAVVVSGRSTEILKKEFNQLVKYRIYGESVLEDTSLLKNTGLVKNVNSAIDDFKDKSFIHEIVQNARQLNPAVFEIISSSDLSLMENKKDAMFRKLLLLRRLAFEFNAKVVESRYQVKT